MKDADLKRFAGNGGYLIPQRDQISLNTAATEDLTPLILHTETPYIMGINQMANCKLKQLTNILPAKAKPACTAKEYNGRSSTQHASTEQFFIYSSGQHLGPLWPSNSSYLQKLLGQMLSQHYIKKMLPHNWFLIWFNTLKRYWMWIPN